MSVAPGRLQAAETTGLARSEDTVGFDFYGVGLSVRSRATLLLDYLSRDFGYFAHARAAPTIKLAVHLDSPPWQRLPERSASLSTPNAVSFDDGPVRYNDYHGQALAIYDFNREEGEIWSEDPDLLYELTYLTSLSRIGEIHDRRGIHRVHALGITVGGRGALVLLPEGGGKSTLALELLKRSEVGLLSDDMPLIARGRLLAFPTRIGIRGDVTGVAPENLRVFPRRNHGPKTLIDLDHFRARIVAEARPHALIVGVRQSGSHSWIEPISRARLLRSLTGNLIIGVGLPQVVEYFLRSGVREVLRKASIVRSRVTASLGLLARSKCYRLSLGRGDPAAADAVLSALAP